MSFFFCDIVERVSLRETIIAVLLRALSYEKIPISEMRKLRLPILPIAHSIARK